MVVGIDFGSTVTDVVAVVGGATVEHAALERPGPASAEVIDLALDSLGARRSAVTTLAVSGGQSRLLPDVHAGIPLVKVDEPTATAVGGLALAGIGSALVVSCGTGTAMISADSGAGRYAHVTGTPVGGGTLEGLGQLLFGLADGAAIATLAASGSATSVDTTLADVLGGALGALPPSATAVSFGRVRSLPARPSEADTAAGLCVMVSQTIALIAVNAARAVGVERVVFVGRVARFPVVSRMLGAVFAVYAFPTEPLIPEHGERATALGAALHAGVSLPA
jgi:type II pantothenate kinase